MTIKTLTLGLVLLLLFSGIAKIGYAITESNGGINPQDAEAWNNKGNVLGDLGRYEEALAAYDKATGIDPQYAKAWNNKGNALGNLGRYEEALAAYDNAIGINPQYAEAWNNKGNALGNLGRYEEANEAFNNAIIYSKKDIVIGTDIYVEPSTSEQINQLKLNIRALIDPNSYIKPQNIRLNYKLNNRPTKNDIFAYSNGSYNGTISVDLKQHLDFPFEDLSTEILVFPANTTLGINTPASFLMNSTDTTMLINAWNQARTLEMNYENNKIKITLNRADKWESIGLYIFGIVIIFLYLFFFIIYNPNKRLDVMTGFTNLGFIFTVTFVISNMKGHFLNVFAIPFIFAIIVFLIIAIKRTLVMEKNNIQDIENENKASKDETKEMLKQGDEK